MEQNEVSLHELEVFRVFAMSPQKWMSNSDVSSLVASVSPRTVRAKTLKLTSMGILDCAEVFPSHRYRLADKAQRRNGGYWDRLVKAAEVLGVDLKPSE